LERVVISSSAIATAPTVRVIVAVNKISPLVNSAIQPRYIPAVPSTSRIFAPRGTTFPMQVDAFGLRAP
jgi:hypothetical protein